MVWSFGTMGHIKYMSRQSSLRPQLRGVKEVAVLFRFWIDCSQSNHNIRQNFCKIVVHVMITDQCNQTAH